MTKRITAALAAMFLIAGLAFAHGDPIVGTVTEVKADTFTIKDKGDKSVVIMFSKDTKFKMNKKAATKADMKVGVRVSVDAEMDQKMKMPHAHEIEIGTAPTTPPAPAKK